MRTSVSSLEDIRGELSSSVYAIHTGLKIPSLSSFSPVPSMQALANQHSSAIGASTGCAVSVANAIGREIEWAATNVKSLTDSLSHQETNLAASFDISADGLNHSVSTQFTHNFSARPEFQVGKLAFRPVELSSELAQNPESLLAQFIATQNSAIQEAQQFWSDLGLGMSSIAESIASTANRLGDEHEGEVFSAASSQLGTLANRIRLVSESSEILATALTPLPEIKGMAISQLQGIVEQSDHANSSDERQRETQQAVREFLTNQYLPQLQASVPTMQSLTMPHTASTATSATVGNQSGVGSPTPTASVAGMGSTSAMSVAHTVFPSTSANPAPTPTVPSGQLGNTHQTTGTSATLSALQPPVPSARLTTRARSRELDQPRTNSGRTRSASTADLLSGREDSMTHRPGHFSSRRMASPPQVPSVPSESTGRFFDNTSNGFRPVTSAPTTGGVGNAAVVGTGNPDKHRAPQPPSQRQVNSALSTGVSPAARRGTKSTPIEKVSRTKSRENSNSNHKRLFGAAEPTVPGILGHELRN